jgi:predicted PurR-regulated permease PerM
VTPDRFGTAIAIWILATLATLVFLREARQLLIPVVLAILISYVLEPIVVWLAAHRVPRLAGTTVLLFALLGLGVVGAYSLRDDATEALEAMPQAARRVRELAVAQPSGGLIATLRQAVEELRGSGQAGRAAPDRAAASNGTARQTDVASQAGPLPAGGSEAVIGTATGLVQRGAGSLFALMGHATVIFFLVFFLLLSGGHVRSRVVEIAGPETAHRKRAAAIIDEINAQIQRFLLVRLATAIVVGMLTWAVLAWMGVDYPAFWGLLAGIFNSIPYFGPIIVSGGLFLVGLVQGGSTTQALQMAGAALVITSIEGWLLTPPLMGKAERMSALAVFLGLLLWTWIWGAWGTILAVPMLVILKAVADHTPSLRPVGRLLAP